MKKTKENKSFKDWAAEEVEKTFGITRLDTLPILEYFKTLHSDVNHPFYAMIEDYRKEALWRIEAWNEDEYKFLFISPFLKLVNFTNRIYSVFTQRSMSVEYDNGTKTTQGKVEWMLARGRQIPEQPHFFLHEYKPEKNRDNDPLGQLLIAMVAAWKLNNDDKPIYGIYVNGRNWFFVVFTGKTFATSLAYDITSDDIFDLFAILEYLRGEMDKMYSVPTAL